MEQVAKDSCESLLLAQWGQEGGGRPSPADLGQRKRGDVAPRAGRDGPLQGTTAPGLGGSHLTQKNHKPMWKTQQ